MIKIYINGKEYYFDKPYLIIQACEIIGINIPRFCYHEKLRIAGNCRMCLVELEGSVRPVSSCTTNIYDGASITTNSEKIKNIRKEVISILLANHPLDCPVCDQGGECDLQDQAYVYGSDKGFFCESKRIVSEKFLSPMIETHMNRCILCSRCVRFIEDIDGSRELGIKERGIDSEIFCSYKTGLTSEMSGNIIDICPVGALNSKPYAYKARPWHLKSCYSIDIMDSTCSSIRFDYDANKILRVLPSRNDNINECWISDKARFSYDGLRIQRIDKAMMKVGGTLKEISLEKAIVAAAEAITSSCPSKIGFISGQFADCELQLHIKTLSEKLKIKNLDSRFDGALLPGGSSFYYSFNSTIKGIANADLIFLVGVNLRFDSPIINSKVFTLWSKKKFPIFNLGSKTNSNFEVEEIGKDPRILEQIANDKHVLCKIFDNAKNPLIIVGHDIFSRDDAGGILAAIYKIVFKFGFVKDGWNGYNVLPRYVSSVGGLGLNILPESGGMNAVEMIKNSSSLDVLYLFGVDDISTADIRSKFVIYQGHHGDNGAHRADLVLPANSYVEQNVSTFLNIEYNVRHSRGFLKSCGDAIDGWQIVSRILSQLGFSALTRDEGFLRQKIKENLDLSKFDENFLNQEKDRWLLDCDVERISNFSIDSFIDKDYYLTDPISRCSKNMLICSSNMSKKAPFSDDIFEKLNKDE